MGMFDAIEIYLSQLSLSSFFILLFCTTKKKHHVTI